MPSHRLAVAAIVVMLAGTLTTACAGRTSTVDSAAGGGEVQEAIWSGQLLPQGNPPLSGNAVIRASSNAREMVVVVSLQGPLSISTLLGWRLERGLCGSPGAWVGRPGDYSPLLMRSDGSGEARATIAEPVPEDGSYSMRIYASQSPSAGLVACGDLARR